MELSISPDNQYDNTAPAYRKRYGMGVGRLKHDEGHYFNKLNLCSLTSDKKLDLFVHYAMVHTMNRKADSPPNNIPLHQIEQFRKLILKLFQCCQERMQYQSEKFGLPDAELRCLLLFGEERYLTAKGIALKLNVVKSRVTIIVNGLIRKKLIQKVQDPNDSRIILLSLTPQGQIKLDGINRFLIELHANILTIIQPEQRNTLLANLEVLKLAMEAVKDTLE